jgi:hypothetical protein
MLADAPSYEYEKSTEAAKPEVKKDNYSKFSSFMNSIQQ